MTEKQYAPGTVAAITMKNGALYGRALRTSDRGWRVPALGDFYYDREVADVRPLMVLNVPDPVNTVKLLRMDGFNFLADQIEQQTRPPKPEEPTGLGAVVKDRKGRRYVRLRGTEYTWPWATGSQHEARWADIDVPDEDHILSYGVTDD